MKINKGTLLFMEMKFIADVHLGKLARLLRLHGFDTVYQNNFTKNELIAISREQDRVLLSRDLSFSTTNPATSFVATDENPFMQLKQVVDHFHLKDQFHPFSRCLVCNGMLEAVAKESIVHLLEKNTATYFTEFWQCRNCKRIYWKGSHYERMLATIQRITV